MFGLALALDIPTATCLIRRRTALSYRPSSPPLPLSLLVNSTSDAGRALLQLRHSTILLPQTFLPLFLHDPTPLCPPRPAPSILPTLRAPVHTHPAEWAAQWGGIRRAATTAADSESDYIHGMILDGGMGQYTAQCGMWQSAPTEWQRVAVWQCGSTAVCLGTTTTLTHHHPRFLPFPSQPLAPLGAAPARGGGGGGSPLRLPSARSLLPLARGCGCGGRIFVVIVGAKMKTKKAAVGQVQAIQVSITPVPGRSP